MELHVTHSTVGYGEVIFDGAVEQGIDLDFMLPDYCPEILRILKCLVSPRIISRQISGGRVLLDGYAQIKILYLSIDSNVIHSADFRQEFSKTIELKESPEYAVVKVRAKTDYCNCRAVNERRVDVKAGITLCLKVYAKKSEEILESISGMGVEVLSGVSPISALAGASQKQFSVKETVPFGGAYDQIQSILRCETSSVINDYRVISGKVILKGEAMVHLFYSAGESGQNLEHLDFNIPINQIIDVSGIDEGCTAEIKLEIVGENVSLSESDGKPSVMVELMIMACCRCYRNTQIGIVSDAFSTKYDSSVKVKSFKPMCLVWSGCQMALIKAKTELSEMDLSQILDLWCCPVITSCRCEHEKVVIEGRLITNVIATDSSGLPFCFERTLEFEQTLEIPESGFDLSCEADLCITGCSYSITGNELEIRCEANFEISLFNQPMHQMVCKIDVDEDSPKDMQGHSALTLYFAEDQESVWEIAKRYNASMNRILEENELEDLMIPSRRMLIIPII